MTNIDLVAIDSTDLETITGGRAWDTTLPQAAVGQLPSVGGGTVGTQPQPRGGLGGLLDAAKTIYAPPPAPSPLMPQQQFQK
jgi:hypothetical protein